MNTAKRLSQQTSLTGIHTLPVTSDEAIAFEMTFLTRSSDNALKSDSCTVERQLVTDLHRLENL